MTSTRVHLQSLALMLPVTCMLSATAGAQSTWVGTTSADWATATNWVPGVPAAGANVTIADATTNSTLNLDSSRTIGLLTCGTSGTRATNFTINSQAANQLTVDGGITANGTWPTNAALTLRGHYIVSGTQTWSVAGSAAHNTDQGVFVREVTTGETNRGSLTLNGNLTKSGVGQLLFAAIDVTGSGNLVVDAGGLKFNAGASQPLVIGGTGNITLNNAATLAVYKNSGTMSVTRPVVMNGTSSLIARNSPVDIASTVAFNGTHTLDAGGTTNLTGALTGSGTINRNGGGTLTLSGNAGGFTGTLNASAGVTNVQGALGGNVGLSGGTLNLNAAASGNVNITGGTLNLNSTVGGTLTLATGATLGGESSAAGLVSLNGGNLLVNATTAGALTASNGLTLTGTNAIAFSHVPAPGASFTVINYGGTLTGGTANLSIPGARIPGFTDTGSTITATLGNATRTWTGAGLTVGWDIGATDNWLEGDLKFYQGDAVTFGNTGAGTVPLTGVLSPASVAINNDTGNDYTFTATAGNLIAGSATITKSGTGTVTLQGVNTFSGGVIVNGGIFKAGGNQALGANGNTITVAAGAELDTSGAMTASRDYQAVIAGTGSSGGGAIINTGGDHQAGFRSVTLSGDATIGGSGRWDIRPITAGTAALNLGGHTLTKTGNNSIAFVDGTLDQPGVINIDQGILAFTRTVVSGTGSVNVNNGATLRLENYTSGTFDKSIVLNGSTLWNSGANPTINAGLTLDGDAKVMVASGSTLTVANPIGGTGTLEKQDTGTLALPATNTYPGTTTVTAGTLLVTGDNSASAATVINGGQVQIGNGGTTGTLGATPITLGSATASIRFNRSDDFAHTGVISGSGIAGNALNPSAVNKDGNNTLTLSAANTFTGTTRLGGGFIAIGSDASVFGDATALIDLRTGGNGGIRSSDASPRTIPNPISYSDSSQWGSPGTGKLTLSGAIAFGGGSKTITVNNDELEISGVITGNGVGTNLTKAGPGVLVLSADNAYTQNTVISDGALKIGNGGTTGSLGTGPVTNNAALVIHRSLPEATPSISLSNLISGTGSVTHSGTAYTILSALNTYTGDTIVTDGTLSLDQPFVADTSAIRVSGTGKVELFHAQTDTVGSFFINGSAQAVGLWGRIGAQALYSNPAINETAFITGDGLLSVTSSGSPYSEWASDSGLTAANDEPTDNPDADGLDNLGEFALDGDPLSGATGGKVVVKVATVGGQPVLTLTIPVRATVGTFNGGDALTAAGDGVTYTIEASDTLGSWLLDVDEVTGPDATAIQTGLPELSGDDWVYRTFRSPGTVTGDPTEFIRARVE